MSYKHPNTLTEKASLGVDKIVGVFSPRSAYKRASYRFAYDAIDKHRTRKKRKGLGGTGDSQLTETDLYKLRETARDLSRNNPLAIGLLETERDGIIGSGVKIQARTGDDTLNKEIESAWREEMLERPCDVTGRFSFNQLLRMAFLSYRRDGDTAIIFTDDELQLIEGEQIGRPSAGINPKTFDVINGVAVSKKTQKVIGYYVGSPNKWGYIKPDSYKKYTTDQMHHLFNPYRISQSRGVPALTSVVNSIDALSEYEDAELVAAKVNACFSMFISAEESAMPDPYTGGLSSSGYDEDENRLEKMEPGTVMYGRVGEKAYGIGQTRPGSQYETFVLNHLRKIGRPLCMPLMLVTLDFTGATFMNARIAYQKVQDTWQAQQDLIVTPLVSRIWRWRLARLIEQKQFSLKDGIFAHEVFCKRWPYVDPWKEAKADEQQLKNGTTTRTSICARQGEDFEEIVARRATEEGTLKKAGLVSDPDKQKS